MNYQPSQDTIAIFYKAEKMINAEIARRTAAEIMLTSPKNWDHETFKRWQDFDNYANYHKNCIDYTPAGLQELSMLLEVNEDLRGTFERVENFIKEIRR